MCMYIHIYTQTHIYVRMCVFLLRSYYYLTIPKPCYFREGVYSVQNLERHNIGRACAGFMTIVHSLA